MANCIKNELDIKTKYKSKYLEVFRGIRAQLTKLISGKLMSPFLSIFYFFFFGKSDEFSHMTIYII